MKKTTSKARKASPPKRKSATPRRSRTGDDVNRMARMISILEECYPDARCQLDFTNAFELLIATILAAQCTDAMVNRITPELFRTYPGPRAFADAPAEEIEKAIFKTGFYRNKTKSIQKCCGALIEKHEGEVPQTMEELLALGGVGRKTANCVLGNVFGIPGIVVDTHVKRIAYRMGYTEQTNPDKIEIDLMAVVPKDRWTLFSHLISEHGRNCCSARRPLCDDCAVADLCPKILD